MRPNYLVIGAQKCATSTLCALLGEHPEVFMTEPKELYFFSHEDRWAKGFEWYERFFHGAGGEKAVGEGTTTYTQAHLHPRASERIAEHLPGARLIYIAREPLARIESHYLHLATKGGRETLPFCEAVRTRPEYIDNTLYDAQIGRYRERFAEDRILALFFEDFRAHPGEVVRRCFEFLEVDPSFRPPSLGAKMNSGEEGRFDSRATRAMRKIPLFSRIRDMAPAWLREPVRRALKKPVTHRPQWDDETKEWALERVREDNRRYCERYGKPGDFWKIDERLSALRGA